MAKDRISDLIHLYVDGAFNRRELIKRLTQCTGSVAASIAVLESQGLLEAQSAGCLSSVQVAENDPAVYNQMLTIHGEGGPLFVYQSLPADWYKDKRPGILVIHENRGLNDHIRDVTRRVAKAGYAAFGVDLLSRQGGTSQFTDPEAQTAAYNRTRPEERRQDMLSALQTFREQNYVRGDRMGAVGFCAGGGNVFDLATNTDLLAAAVVFYGPPPSNDQLANIRPPLLGIFAENDRGITGRVPDVLNALNTPRKPYELHIYQGVGHAFHNNTGAAYNAEAACDAWDKTLRFFSRNLNRA